MQRLAPILALLALIALVACPHPTESTVEGPASQDDPSVVPAGAVDPGPTPNKTEGKTKTETKTETTEGGCLSDSDCEGGGTCEGEGCGDDQPGTCGASDRMCTRDAQMYCGCDGENFRGSGSCPGRRYAHRGEC